MKKLVKKAILTVAVALMMIVKAYHVDIIELPQEELFVVDNEEDREVLEAAYNQLPESVRVAFEREHGQIILLPEKTDLVAYLGDKVPEEYEEYNNETNGRVIGKYDRETDKIYIVNLNEVETTGTLIHEMGHFVGSQGSLWDKVTLFGLNHFTEEWENVWVNECQYASDYAALSDAEGFAEGFKFMVTDTERFELWYPQSYEFIQNCIAEL